MNLIRLKFPDQQTAEALLKYTFEGVYVDKYPNTIWLNQGAFYKRLDNQGNELAIPEAPDGYNADLVANACPAELEPYKLKLEPQQPKHVLFL